MINNRYTRRLTIDGSGKMHINGSVAGAQLQVDAVSATTIGQIIKAAASQTANLTEWTTSADAVVAKVTPTGGALFSDKVSFTQTDGNEYIDSLADGYMDYGATTGHRFDNDIFLGADNRKICFGTDGATDSYIQYDGGELDILSATDINLEPSANLQINGVSGWTGTFTNGDGATVTVAKGIITNVA